MQSALILALLLFYLPPENAFNTSTQFLLFFAPRLTIVLLLQVVATFFLRMHASNEAGIERNKNEITNLELKMIAIQISDGGSQLREIAKSLASEDRRLVDESKLSRGIKLDQRGLLSMVGALSKNVENFRSK